jgi:hypothetical protein
MNNFSFDKSLDCPQNNFILKVHQINLFSNYKIEAIIDSNY